MKGIENNAADTQSLVNINALDSQGSSTNGINFEQFDAEQNNDPTLQDFRHSTTSSLVFKDIAFMSPQILVCAVSTGNSRRYVPMTFCQTVFNNFHTFSHPGMQHSV